MKRNLTSIIVVLSIILLSLSPSFARAEERTYGPYSYKVLQDGTAEITMFMGENESISIPEKINGIVISSIGEYAFMTGDVRSVEIGSNIKVLKSYSFFGCPIEKVTINSPDIEIGSDAFSCCDNLEEFILRANNVVICDSAFMNALPLASFKWELADSNAGSKAIIEHCGFFGSGIEELSIPCTEVTIGEEAFSCCENLYAIRILGTTVNIEQGAFMSCSSLNSFEVPNAKKGEGTIGKQAFFGTGLTEFIVPICFSTIQEEAFSCSSELSEVTISENVSNIEKLAFLGCGDSLVIYTTPGSKADEYCKDNKITVEYLD